MKEDNHYSLGHFAVLLAGDRYVEKAKEIARLSADYDSDEERHNLLQAMTYMSGVIDMTCLYLGVTNGENAADHLRHIDNKIAGILDGTYGMGDEDEPAKDIR